MFSLRSNGLPGLPPRAPIPGCQGSRPGIPRLSSLTLLGRRLPTSLSHRRVVNARANTRARAPYRRQAQRYLGQNGFKADFARMDEVIATEMAKGGRFTVGDIEQGIRQGSLNVEICKAGHMQDYARRTVEWAWAAPEVQQHRQEQLRERERQLQRGRDGPSMER